MNEYNDRLLNRIKSDKKHLNDAHISVVNALGTKVYGSESSDNLVYEIKAVNELLSFYVKIKPLTIEVNNYREYIDFQLKNTGVIQHVVKLSGKWYKDSKFPMLGIRADSGEIVYLKPGLFGLTYFDSQLNKNIRITKNNCNMFVNEAMLFILPIDNKVTSVKTIVKSNLNYMAVFYLFFTFVFTMALLIATSFVPIFTQQLFGDVLNSGALMALAAVGFCLFTSYISTALISLATNLLVERCAHEMNFMIEAGVFNRVLMLPLSFHKQYSVSDLNNRIQYASEYFDKLTRIILYSGTTVLYIFLYLLKIFDINKSFFWPTVIIIFGNLILTIFTFFACKKNSEELLDVVKKEDGLCYSILDGIKKIRTSGSENRMFALWTRMLAENIDKSFNPRLIIKLYPVITKLISSLAIILMYYVALSKRVEPSLYISFNVAFGILMANINLTCQNLLEFAQIVPKIEKAEPMFQIVPETNESSSEPNKLKGEITVSNVSFSYYDNNVRVLDDVSFHVSPGEYVAICGQSGCGKSTILKLLLGNLTPSSGNILFDSCNLKNTNIRAVRRQIGCVLQDDRLIYGTIRSNILLTHPDIEDEKVWEALKIVGLDELVKSLPMGLETTITDTTGSFSGGQKQRLLIARAIVGKPAILLMDEATSALDNNSQKFISESLNQINATRLIVAHRLSTIKNCDKIFFLEGGKIVDCGNYEDLYNRCEQFKNLVCRQQINGF